MTRGNTEFITISLLCSPFLKGQTMSNRYRPDKIHMAGEVTGTGHIRTLCQGYMATGIGAVKATGLSSEVTCQRCLFRLEMEARVC